MIELALEWALKGQKDKGIELYITHSPSPDDTTGSLITDEKSGAAGEGYTSSPT